MPMNPEIKAEWTAALRSGEYEQGTGYLNKGNKLCCLGVLCELAVKTGLPVLVEEENSGMGGTPFRMYDNQMSYPPISVAEWAGLAERNPIINEESGPQRTLAGRNDGGATFGQIADLIDQYL